MNFLFLFLDSSWLLIFDNVTSLDSVKGYIPTGNTGSVIFTSRLASVSLGRSSNILIEGLNPEEGSLLLNQLTNSSLATHKELSELLGGCPLAIAHVGGFINKSGISIPEFIQNFCTRENKRLKKKVKQKIWKEGGDTDIATFSYDKTMDTVFDITLNNLGEHARTLLDFLAFFNPDQIWEDLIFQDTSGMANMPPFLEVTKREQDINMRFVSKSHRHDFCNMGVCPLCNY